MPSTINDSTGIVRGLRSGASGIFGGGMLAGSGSGEQSGIFSDAGKLKVFLQLAGQTFHVLEMPGAHKKYAEESQVVSHVSEHAAGD